MRSRNSKALSRRSFLPALLCCAALAQDAANDSLASVAGIVTNAVTGDPVLRAHVTLRSSGAGGEMSFRALTDAEGKFLIPNLPPGTYFAAVQRTGFVESGRPGAAEDIILRAGENRTLLALKLIPAGAIAGRVLDTEGNPVELAQVYALNGGAGETDDKGRFRIGGLRPGKYQLRAEVNDLPFPPEVRTDGTVEMHYSPTYYPASLTQAGSAKVEVKAGEETGGIEIRLVATPIVGVSGTVSGFPGDVKNIELQLQSETGSFFRGAGVVQGNGPFRIWRLDPGKYRLFATAGYYERLLRTAPVDIEVAGSSIENVELRVVPPANLSGMVQFEDEQAKQPRSPDQPLTVDLREASGLDVDYGGRVEPAEVGPDGSFTFKNVQPDRYRIGLSWERLYIKSAWLGSAEITDGIVDLRNGAGGAPLTLVLSAATASISGTVRGENGPVANAPVVLLFDTVGGGVAGFTRSQADGSYYIQGIAPGKYKLAAVDSDDNAALLRGDLEDYGDSVKAIEIEAREQATADLSQRKR
jgi:hypothetical protein